MAGEKISRGMALHAHDHLTALLLRHSEGGVLQRADVDHVVTTLRKDGRGTEALALSNLYAMVAHVDHEKSDQLTTAHFARARAFFAKTLYQRGGPLSAAEIALMSPTLRALIEIGQVLEAEKRPGRIPHHIPKQGMDHIAAMLLQMTRPDASITRHDRDLMVYDLFERGRGNEALAVRYFFNFIDHRSGSLLDEISPSAIADAVSYSEKKLLRNKDRDNNGYSADEIARFSTTAKAFLRVGLMIDAGLITALA